MKRLVFATAAVAAIGTAVPALADASHDHGEGRNGQAAAMGQGGPGQMMMGGGMGQMMRMMKMMHGGQAGMMGGGMMGGGMMGGGMMGGGMMGGGMMGGGDHMPSIFDADQDGTVTPEELRAGLLEGLATYDADGDGKLSLDEFEAMHAAHIREMTVDRFQAFDADGDGQVTAEEIAAPADRMQRMMERRAADNQQAMPMMDGDGQGSDMMDNN